MRKRKWTVWAVIMPNGLPVEVNRNWDRVYLAAEYYGGLGGPLPIRKMELREVPAKRKPKAKARRK
jgi:hypothetical protein